MVSKADELEKLASLRDRGVISGAEFDAQKEQILSGDAHAASSKASEDKTGMSGGAIAALCVVGAVVVFLGFGAIVGNSPEAKERQKKRDAISLCWQEQARKSLTPGTQRFVASACERMEEDFRKAYGRNP